MYTMARWLEGRASRTRCAGCLGVSRAYFGLALRLGLLAGSGVLAFHAFLSRRIRSDDLLAWSTTPVAV